MITELNARISEFSGKLSSVPQEPMLLSSATASLLPDGLGRVNKRLTALGGLARPFNPDFSLFVPSW